MTYTVDIFELEEMFVEKRNPSAPTGFLPDITIPRGVQIQEAIVLNDKIKTERRHESVTDILIKYIPLEGLTPKEIKNAARDVCGFRRAKDCAEFVADDMCLERFNMALQYCLNNKQDHRDNLDFIDGSGIGYVNKYVTRLKETLEQAFTDKWYYKQTRPMQYIMEEYGIDLSEIANHPFPPHPDLPAGHGTKFLTALEVLDQQCFILDEHIYRTLFIDACVESIARSFNLIHDPISNLLGGFYTTLPEFNKLNTAGLHKYISRND